MIFTTPPVRPTEAIAGVCEIESAQRNLGMSMRGHIRYSRQKENGNTKINRLLAAAIRFVIQIPKEPNQNNHTDY